MPQVSTLPLHKENWNPTNSTFFLSEKREIAYLQIPKAACFTFMSIILRIEDPDRYNEIKDRLSETVFELHRDEDLLTHFAELSHFIATSSVAKTEPSHIADLKRNLAISNLEPGLDFPSFIDRLIESPRAISNIHVRRQVDFHDE